MSIALDLGVDRICSLRQDGERVVARRCSARYATIVDSPVRREALTKLGISFATGDENIILVGDEAEKYSQLFQMPATPLFADGALASHDPLPRQVVSALIDSLLPGPAHENELCMLSLPGAANAHNSKGGVDQSFLIQLVRLKGYQPQQLDAAMAVGLAELGREGFTGIGISLGAGTSQACLMHRGSKVACATIARGGNAIDQQLAEETAEFFFDSNGRRYLNTWEARRWKEEDVRNLATPQNVAEDRLQELYIQLLDDLLVETGEAILASGFRSPNSSGVSLVCAGGTARIGGFTELLGQRLAIHRLPLRIKAMQVAARPHYAVARGCLIKAELESSDNASAPLRAAA